MPWATRLFLINLSSSDLLVGLIACAPAVLPAATDRWTYGDYLACPWQVDLRWCLVSSLGSVSRHVMLRLHLEHIDGRTTQVRI